MKFITNNEWSEFDPHVLEALCKLITRLRAEGSRRAGSGQSENVDELLAEGLSDILSGKQSSVMPNTDEGRLKRLLQPLVNSLLGTQVSPRSKDRLLENLLSDVFENDSAIAWRNFLNEADFLKALRKELVRRAEETLVKLRKQ